MSDYDQHWRQGQNVQRINLDGGGGGAILWALAAIAVFLAVIMVAAFSGGSSAPVAWPTRTPVATARPNPTMNTVETILCEIE